jgi:hypothetical protein
VVEAVAEKMYAASAVLSRSVGVGVKSVFLVEKEE